MSKGLPAVAVEDVAWALAGAAEVADPDLGRHHLHTALLCRAIGRQMKLNGTRLNDVIVAGLLHDIGVLATGEFLELQNFELEPNDHARVGSAVLATSPHFDRVAKIVAGHHDAWREGADEAIDIDRQIVHLADRIEVMLGASRNPLAAGASIRAYFATGDDRRFHPKVVDAFLDASGPDSFWLQAVDQRAARGLLDLVESQPRQMSFADLQEFCTVFGMLVDLRSPYTATHSYAVAKVAGYMAQVMDLSPSRANLLEVAGHLHDIGKLCVPLDILHKPGKLTDDEFALVRQHSYHSGRIVGRIRGLELVARWASHHHECQDGSGYPYGLRAHLTIEEKIICVADRFVALIEDRPYRKGFDVPRALDILLSECEKGRTDVVVTAAMSSHANSLERLTRESQAAERVGAAAMKADAAADR